MVAISLKQVINSLFLQPYAADNVVEALDSYFLYNSNDTVDSSDRDKDGEIRCQLNS